MLTVDLLVELAKDVETQDPIDWGMLSIDEDAAYRLIAANVLEIYKDYDQATMLVSITKLIVENFVLNLKLAQKEHDVN